MEDISYFEKCAEICFHEQEKCDEIGSKIAKISSEYKKFFGSYERNYFRFLAYDEKVKTADKKNKTATKERFLKCFYAKKVNALYCQRQILNSNTKKISMQLEDINRTMNFGLQLEQYDTQKSDEEELQCIKKNYELIKNQFVAIYQKNKLVDNDLLSKKVKFSDVAKEYVYIVDCLKSVDKRMETFAKSPFTNNIDEINVFAATLNNINHRFNFSRYVPKGLENYPSNIIFIIFSMQELNEYYEQTKANFNGIFNIFPQKAEQECLSR